MHLSNFYLPSLESERLSYLFSPLHSASWRKLLASTPCADSWTGQICKFMLLVPASSLQVFFCEQHKQWISLLLLQKSGKQRNSNLIFVLILKQRVWMDWFKEEKYFLLISKMSERRQDTLSVKCEGKFCCEVSKLLRVLWAFSSCRDTVPTQVTENFYLSTDWMKWIGFRYSPRRFKPLFQNLVCSSTCNRSCKWLFGHFRIFFFFYK